ncbi:MAG: hypothetical protein ABF780_05640 [Bifidobacterium aquikefiri]|uniref:Uncharacterized protein n=1 Tax=Bifidobacterium aquikefiri TaxID=1653207 RepID=A0A261G2U8_9BIFI|nr:hypothetical protein [Bifidobacterium aquikefiri]OZG65555.1 hypothetical protein BAQU_1738 [Bifidobacterium aquikefiri]
MDTATAIQLATVLAGGVTSSVIVQLVKKYIPSDWRLPFSLVLSGVIALLALWLTGSFQSPLNATVITAAVMGVAQTIYAVIAKAYVDLDTTPVTVTTTPTVTPSDSGDAK